MGVMEQIGLAFSTSEDKERDRDTDRLIKGMLALLWARFSAP